MEAVVETRGAWRCDHCGFPAAPGATYCCYGCELAARLKHEAANDAASTRASVMLAAFLVMNLMTFSLVLYGDDVYGQTWDAMRRLFRTGSFFVSLPVYAILGWPLARSALGALRNGRMTAELLVVVGAGAAFVASLRGLASGGDVWFETGCMVLLLTTIGRYVEALARASAGASLQARLRVGGERAVRVEGDERREISVAEVARGDRLHVRAGGAVPVDGKALVEGHTSIAVLTGEPEMKRVFPGDRVPAGAIAEGAPLEIEATSTGRDSTLAVLATLIERARARRSNVQRLADALAGVLVPIVAVVAAITFFLWMRSGGWNAAVATSLAVVLVACPCSFGLAVPLATSGALEQAALEGVVVRGADVLERAAKVKRVVIDKTGTLTSGLEVAAIEASEDESEPAVLRLACALEAEVEHPIAEALRRFGASARIVVPTAKQVESIAGVGVRGVVDERRVELRRAQSSGAEIAVDVVRDDVAVGTIRVKERLRPEAREAVVALRALGIDVEIATGDSPVRGRSIGEALGVEARGALAPDDKLAHFESRAGLEETAMVGDGYNDAPALARAGVGIALGCGIDAAQCVASVSIADSDLRRIPWLFSLARRARRIALQNLAWALVYNGSFVGLAAAGHMKPVAAAIAMLGSSAIVLVNSLRLRPRDTHAAAPKTTEAMA